MCNSFSDGGRLWVCFCLAILWYEEEQRGLQEKPFYPLILENNQQIFHIYQMQFKFYKVC